MVELKMHATRSTRFSFRDEQLYRTKRIAFIRRSIIA
jgi:hypothetical protein